MSTVTIQEDESGFCGVHGSVDSNNQGFSGNGFANSLNAREMRIKWSVAVHSAGTYALEWRYANGSAGSRSASVFVGRQYQSTQNFSSTGAWDSWSTVSVNVPLEAGENQIYLHAESPGGIANIDSLTVSGEGLSLVDCSLPAIPASDPDTNNSWAPATTGDTFSHDPSRILESEGRFYVYSTNPELAKSSADGIHWRIEPSPLAGGFPSWLSSAIPGDNQHIWAPDIIFYRGKYLYYYSVCGVGKGAPCLIGLATNTTLNPSSPDYDWKDAGMALHNPPNSDSIQFSTIDAAPIVDPNGDLWVVWGSGYGKDQSRDQIFVTRMNNDTGLPLESDPSYNPPVQQGYALKTGRIEGAYVHYRDGYYYLFWNDGGCCAGTASTYTMYVSRSTSITGPYTGNRVFFATMEGRHGPGHMGIYSHCGIERFTYHYYPDPGPRLGINKLSWASDGWPVLGAPMNTPMQPCLE